MVDLKISSNHFYIANVNFLGLTYNIKLKKFSTNIVKLAGLAILNFML